MHELFMIYQNCRKKAKDFNRRIIPIILPDARQCGGLAARLKLAAEWNQKLNEISNKTVEIFTEQIESFQRIRGIFTIRAFYNASGTKEPR